MTDLPGTVLVVDDHAPNRELLADVLALEGYAVLTAASGREALLEAANSDPDLVLLDVHMPDMDGLEVCRRLRTDKATEPIPIILVTSLTDREDRLNGIAAGANDYLTKPIDRTDLLLRVRNALSVRRLHRQLSRQFERLTRVELLRDDMVHMLVHDLRTPLTMISCTLEMLRHGLADNSGAPIRADVDAMQRGVRQMADMISTVLDVSRLEADAMPLDPRPVDLSEVVHEAIDSAVRPGDRVMVRQVPAPAPVVALADAGLIRRVIANLVHNAVKFSPPHGEVVVEVAPEPGFATVRVSDTGPGVSPEHQATIFEKFGQVDAPRGVQGHSSGLGLTFCKLAVEAHGGTIGVESRSGEGSVFWFTLPGPRAAA